MYLKKGYNCIHNPTIHIFKHFTWFDLIDMGQQEWQRLSQRTYHWKYLLGKYTPEMWSSREIRIIIAVRTLLVNVKLNPASLEAWGRYHQEPSSQLITLKSQIFPVKNANLHSSGLIGLVANSSDFKTRPFFVIFSLHNQDFECLSIFFVHKG